MRLRLIVILVIISVILAGCTGRGVKGRAARNWMLLRRGKTAVKAMQLPHPGRVML